MKPAPFDYVRAGSVEDAVAVLAEHGDEARVLAGGQSLMPMLNMRLVRPEILVDIGGLPELAHIEDEEIPLPSGRRSPRAIWPTGRNSIPPFPSSPRRCPMSAISRPATGAQSADRSAMPIRPPNCRSASPCSAARSNCTARAACGRFRRTNFSRAC